MRQASDNQVIDTQDAAVTGAAARYAHIPPPPPPPAHAFGAPAYAPRPTDAAPPRRRRGIAVAAGVLGALALVAGVVALAARGGDEAASPLAAAASATEAMKTAHVTVTATGPGLPDAVRVDGQIDFVAGASQFTADLSSLAGSLGDRVDLPPGTGSIEIITQGSVTYLSMGALGGLAELTGGSVRWVKIDAAKLPQGASGPFGSSAPATGSDPGALLDLLREQADSLVTVGQEVVGGVPTTHSTATFDLARIARDGARDLTPEQLDQLLAQVGNRTFTVDVWIDADDLVRKATTRVPADGGEITVTIELSDFGAPVRVTVPAASEVFDLTTLLGK